MSGNVQFTPIGSEEDDDEKEMLSHAEPELRAPPPAGVRLNLRNGIFCALLLVVVFLVGKYSGEYASAPSPSGSPVESPPAETGGEHVSAGGGKGGEHLTPPTSRNKPTASPTEAEKPAKFTKERAKATKKAAKELRKMLEDYYHPTETMLYGGWANPPDSDSFKEGHAYMVETMARALVDDEQKEFIIGTIGSSVAAGHDNCQYDSYENQMNRTFSGVWRAAGMKLVMQNAGEGGGCGDSFENQIFCVSQNVAPWSDIVHYSWTYFEHGRAESAHEALTRWAQFMDHQPPVHILSASGTRDSCLKERYMHSKYSKFGYNGICLETGIFQNGKWGGKVWGQVGDGVHNTTRYGELEEDKNRKDSLGVVFRNWHPGPLGFQYISDAFSYYYAGCVIDAIELVEKEWKAGREPRDKWKAERLPRLNSDLPPIQGCSKYYCDLEGVPGCINFEEPTYGWHGPAVVGQDDDLNPFKDEVLNWAKWRDAAGSSKLIPGSDKRKYSAPDSPISCEHLDHCAGLRASTPENGWLSFKLPKMVKGVIIICGCCGKDVAKSFFIENLNLEIKFDSVVLDHSTFDIFPNNKCARVMKAFPEDLKDETGHLYLGIRIKPGAESPQQVTISHVIAF